MTGPPPGLDDAQLFSLDDDPPAPTPDEDDEGPPPSDPADESPPAPPHLPVEGPIADLRSDLQLLDPYELVEGLNPPQRAAVEHRGGPLLVVAGAGSGKTRVLTRRIAHLLATGDALPWEILAITFTNKAADEMRRRVVELVGPEARRMWVSTFHSACLRMLRSHADRLGYRSSFTVYDDADSLRLIEIVAAELDIDTKQLPPRSVAAVIGQAKAELIDAAQYREQAGYGGDPFARRIADVYAVYQQRLLAANAMDFDDLLLQAVRLLKTCDDVRRGYQERFVHVLVDEYQDTNRAQHELVALIGKEQGNVCVVGDGDQCLPAGTLVATPAGDVPIEKIRPGDAVMGCDGSRSLAVGTVSEVHRGSNCGVFVTVRAGDSVLSGTPHHMVPARLALTPGSHVVYLMWRADRGYRVGRTMAVRPNSRGKAQPGFTVRMNQEHADKIWVLRICGTLAEAAYWESLFAAAYGLPTACFHANGRHLAMDEVLLERLYREVDTVTAAKELMEDELLHPEYPHYVPQNGLRRQTLNLTMFSDRRAASSAYHRVQWSSNRADIAQRILDAGFAVRGNGGARGGFRFETSRKEYRQALALARDAAAAGGLDLRRRMLIDGLIYHYTPISHLRPGMRVLLRRRASPSADDSGVAPLLEERSVDEVTFDERSGDVYDLEVDSLHSYVAEGLLVHNSIYAFRGADVRNVLDFEKAFPDATTILLEQNYRSTQTILDAANAVIANNTSRRPKRLFTEGAAGDPICRYRAEDERDEAGWVAAEIARLRATEDVGYGDIAVFYRTNAQSRVVEEELVRAGVPYKVVGGTRFYERREIKDVLAYLRLLANPEDEVSTRRVVNVPKRGIGATSVQRLAGWAAAEGRGLAGALAYAAEAGLSGRALKGATELDALITELREAMATVAPGELVQLVAERTGYLDDLRAERSHEADGRIENVAELVGVAGEYDDLAELLETVALVSDSDELDTEATRVSLMTLHTAKGLEFPAVFLVGLEDGVFPHFRALGEPRELEEERRLCYVGITRARRWLYLSHAWVRTLWGRTTHNIPSRFLAEVPAELVRDVGTVGSGRARRTEGADRSDWADDQTDWADQTDGTTPGTVFGAGRGDAAGRPRPRVSTGAEDLGLRAGDEVVHDHWGEGVVVAADGEGDRAQATVRFASVGEKRLLLTATPLRRA